MATRKGPRDRWEMGVGLAELPMQMIEERGTAGLEREHMLCHGGIGGGEYGKAREGVSFRPGMTLAEGGKCTNCAAVSRRRA